MRIIAFEEHSTDVDIAAASRGELLKMAPYIKDFAPPKLKSHDVLEDRGEARLAGMDANGIAMQVLSLSDYPQVLAPEQAVPLCQAANDRLASTVRAHPDRFGAFATLPLSDPVSAAAELERVVLRHGFRGALINGRPEAGPRFLDYPSYAPVLSKAHELSVPLYLHPGFPYRAVEEIYYAGFKPVVGARLATFGWGWHNEAGIHVLRLILSGAFDRYPNLKVIAGHWGEMVPFFLDRLDAALPPEVTGLKRTISDTFREHIFVTPSGMFMLPHCKFILETLGSDRILFSVDYPYLPNDGAREFLERATISQADRKKIAHENAERLLRL